MEIHRKVYKPKMTLSDEVASVLAGIMARQHSRAQPCDRTRCDTVRGKCPSGSHIMLSEKHVPTEADDKELRHGRY